ncbi:imidazolonepropionase [Cytobacillus sp. FJAT-54145]|uniref:Imidazolonepropionase n=1 Tax=Cytobacillus spartinae TaxID=3299023 RepID=A0ABW6K5N2_9BACI
MSKSIFIEHANQLITLKGKSNSPRVGKQMSDLQIIEDGAVYIESGKIVEVGKTEEIKKKLGGKLEGIKHIDATGKIVTPGFVDPHTHLVYAGSREEEFNMRLNGASYMDIMNNGGGIHATTFMTRNASSKQLFNESKRRLDQFLLHGVTTLEAKSGYGLEWDSEMKQLTVAKELNAVHPIDIVSTFMGAHAVPKEYKGCPDAYIDLIIEEMLPHVAKNELAEFNDVFCERGVFTPEQSRRVLEAGKRLGLTPKIHADEIEPYEGAELAVEVGAISADHLLKISQKGIQLMADKGVIGVLLPGTAFFLMTEAADGRKMIDQGVPIALSTDCNPGSSPTCSTPLIMNLACIHMGMTPAEVLTATTINAAYGINRGNEIGSIEIGKKGDLAILNVPNFMQLLYHFGMNHTHTVIKDGEIVVQGGKLCYPSR